MAVVAGFQSGNVRNRLFYLCFDVHSISNSNFKINKLKITCYDLQIARNGNIIFELRTIEITNLLITTPK